MKKILLSVFFAVLFFLPAALFAQTAPTSVAGSGASATSLSFDWVPATGATNYFYDLSTDNFTSTLPSYTNVSTGSTAAGVSITGLTASTTYYFRVRTVTSGGTSTNSSIVTLATQASSNFTATYDFNSIVSTLAATDPTPAPVVDNVTFSSYTLAGAAASAGAGRYAANTWGTAISSPFNSSNYYSVTITPSSGHSLTLTTLTFMSQHSATGPQKYSVRSSIDNYATDLPASVNPANANITVTSNVFSMPTTITTGQAGNTITFPAASFAGLTSAVTIRIYPFYDASAATTGTFSVDNVSFIGTTASTAGDVMPPVNAANYPKTANLGSTSVDVVSNLDEVGTTYYVLSPAATTAPTITQIMAGQDGTGSAALKSGSFSVPTANTDASASISGLTASTSYKIYVVSKDAAATPNVQTSFSTLSITTNAPPADVTPPVNATNYPKANNATSASIDVVSNLNEIGTTYYVVLPTTGTAPTTSAQVKAGQDGNGNAVALSGSFSVPTANTDATKTVSGLTASTSYNIYVVSEDAIPNLQAAFSTLNATTTADITPPVNATNYPKANNATSTTIDVVSNLNEVGTTYYVAIPASGTAPTTVAQIKAGQDGNSNLVTTSGSFSVPTANTDATKTITGLTASTAYNIYVVSQDAAGTPNLQTAFSTLSASTTAPPTPAIGTTGTLIALLTASGTASPNTSFSVSGTNMTEGILVTAPTGFEVSTVATSGFASSITVGAAGTIASTTVFVRLTAVDAANTYSGNVALTSSGATTVNVATVSSTVTPLPILAWDFGPDASNTNATHASTTSDGNLAASVVSRGAGLTASGLAGGFSASNFTASGDLNDAIANNKYIQFTIGANAGKAVSLSTLDANLRRSSTGPNAYQWQYSLDGNTFTSIGSPVSYTSTNTNGDPQTQIVLSGISALQNVVSGTTITFRLYAYGATATGGTFAFGKPTQPANDLAITGTISIAPPTVSYASPQTYLQNTAITALTPTATNVAAPSFNTVAIGSAFLQPTGVAMDALGNIYVADAGASSVYKMSSTGTGGTTIGSGILGLGAVALDASGNMYVTEVNSGKLKKVTTGGVVTDIVTFASPTGIVLDASGNIFVADKNTNQISEVLSGGTTASVIASGFSTPYGLTIDPAGNLYVANQGNGKLQKIDATTHAVTDIVTISPGLTGLTMDGAGNLYYTNIANHTVNEILSGTTSSVSLSSGFTTPAGLVTDATGNAYVADATSGGAVKKVARTGGYYITPSLPAGLSMDGTTGAISGTPTVASAATNYTITGFNTTGGVSTVLNITVTAQPVITTTGTLSALTTTYATASPSGTFNVLGANLTAGILVTPPAGFEVSTDNITFSSTVTIGAAGTVTSTPVYIRLASTDALGSAYSGNVALTSSGANTVNVATATSSVTAAPLTITANGVTKSVGTAITGGAGSTAFTSSGLKNSETIGSVTITYGSGSAAGDPANTYTGSVVPSAATGGTFTASNYSITYQAGDITVTAAPTPTISTTGTLSALTTTYGTASGSGTFSVSGANMTAGILVTPPTGFEVSTNNSTFSPSVTVGAAGTISSTPVYIRLAATLPATTYSGNVVLASSGAINVNVATATSTINPAPITIAAKAVSKTYGQTLTSGTVLTTAFTVTGTLKNGETITGATITYGPGALATDAVNTYTGTVVPSAVTGANGFLTSNYNITYTNNNITITQAALTITAGSAAKTYGTLLSGAAGSTAFTSAGLLNSETIGSVTVAYGTGSAATAAVNTYTGSVTASAATGGTFAASNYAITYAPGDIVVGKAALTITANTANKTYGVTLTGAAGSTAFTSTGLANSETIGSVTLAYGTGSAAIAAVNTYTGSVTPSAATGGTFVPGNYTITYASGNIVIGAAPLTITASAVNKTYGVTLTGAAGSAAFTSTGLVNSETIGSVTIVYGTGSAATAAVNTYTGSVTPSAATGGTFAASNYTIAYATGNIVVGKANLSITANNVSKVYGTALTGAAGSTAFTSTGLANSETIGSVTIAYGTGSAATAAGGSYTGSVTPSAATGGTFTAGNYNLTYVPGNITVTLVSLSVTVSNATKAYGAANPAFVVNYTGFVGADNAASLTTQPTVTTTATTTSGVGAYTLTASGGVSTNYTFVYAGTGTLTVTPVPLTITADAKTKAYNTANPILTATYTGFVGTDNAASLTTQPTFATTAATNSLPGTYPITVSGAASPNYTITYVAGVLTVSAGNNANLAFLTISSGSLSPAFASTTKAYTDTVTNAVDRISVTPTLGDPAANLQVNGTQVGSGNSSIFIPLSTGNNTITILITAQDGVTKSTYTVIVYRPVAASAITASNIMSPNGDGKNDTWVIKDINLYPNNNVNVYDRGGRVVYSKHGYTNDWTGTLRGAPLAEGTYYYTVELDPKLPIIKGFITILRTR